ncbi:MAG: hypothetical protein JXB06_01600, partial [Spirochaetales bacterium]|nr:hypothetical protein [Spirochaetales bacterium]
ASASPGSVRSFDVQADSRQQRERNKAQKREQRRLEREEEQLLGELDGLEEEKLRLEHLLAREEVYRDGQRVRQIKEQLQTIVRRRDGLMRRWETVDTQREQI